MKRRIWAAYFSATGTTEKIVGHIADRLAASENSSDSETAAVSEPSAGSGNPAGSAGKAERFDFTLPEKRSEEASFSPQDLVVFGVPVYAGRVPNVLLKYLDTIQGGGALAVPVVLFGNRNFDDGLIELRNILEKDGFHTIAAAGFVGEHSFSTILGAGRPDSADMALADRFADQVAEKLKRMDETAEAAGSAEPNAAEAAAETSGAAGDAAGAWTPIHVRGEDPIRGYYQPRDRQGNHIDIRKVKPKVAESCTRCGICAEVCPMGSIDREDVTQYVGICIKCGACIKKCPEHARYYDDPGYLYHQHELEEAYTERAEPELFL